MLLLCGTVHSSIRLLLYVRFVSSNFTFQYSLSSTVALSEEYQLAIVSVHHSYQLGDTGWPTGQR